MALLALLGLLFTSSIASAAYLYSIDISVTNTGSAQTNLVVFATVDNDLLADNGFIEADALDTNAEEGGTSRAYLPRDSRVGVYLPSLATNETKIVTYELGYSPVQTDFYFMAGPDGSVSTADAANLEPGASNFEVEWSGYFDATKTGDLIAKGASYGLISATAGQVKAFIGAGSSTYTEPNPNAAGNYNQWTVTGASSAWEAVDDPEGSPNDSDYIQAVVAAYRTSVNLQNPGLEGAYITSVVVYFRARLTAPDTTTITPFLRVRNVNSDGTPQAPTGSWVTYSQTIGRPGGGSWQVADFANLEVGVLCQTPSEVGWVSQLYVRVNYTAAGSTGVTDTVASGSHIFRMVRTGTSLELFTDAVSQGTTTVTDPPNQTSVVTSFHNGPSVYADYATIDIAGTEVLRYEPNAIIVSTTLPDRSADTANDGTITFSNDAPTGVTVAVAGMESTTQFDIAGQTRNEPEALGVYSESFTDTEPTGVLFYDEFKAFSGVLKPAGQADAIPVRWLIIPIYMVILLGLSLLTYKGTRQLWISAVVVAFGLVAAVPMGLWDAWVPTIYVLMAFTVIGVKTWVLQ